MTQTISDIKQGEGLRGADLLLRLEQETGKTVYELFAACYLSHHMMNEEGQGKKSFCKCAPMHSQICTDLRTSRRNVFISPAKFAKSTWVSFFQPLCDGVLGLMDGNILSISNTGRMAEQWLSMIKDEIELNKDLKHDFGNLKGNIWRQDRIRLRGGIELHSLGLNYQIRSTGWAKVNGDDMEDDEMVRSDDQREKFSDWFDGALLGRAHPHTWINLIGTNLHPLCKIKKIHDNSEGRYNDWIRRKWAALDDDGQSIWPDRWPTDVVLKQRQEMGEKAFLAEKMNEPVFGKDHIFKPEWIRYYDMYPPNLLIVTSFDSSSSKAKDVGDYCGHTVWGKDCENDRYYLLCQNRGRWSLYDKIKALFDQDRAWNPTYNLIEKDAYGNELSAAMEKEAQKRQVYFPKRLIIPDRNKERRAESTADLWQQGRVFLPRRGAERLIDEHVMFPYGDYDDLVDSSAMALRFLRRQRSRLKVYKPINRVQLQPNTAGRLT